MAKEKIEDVLTFPMAPMLDVMFQILVFFVATYRTDMPEAHLAVNMPSTGKPPPGVQPHVSFLEITVLPEETLIQGRAHSPESMRETLNYLGKLDTEQLVIIKTSTKARTGSLVHVLDMCKSAGLSKLNLVTLRD